MRRVVFATTVMLTLTLTLTIGTIVSAQSAGADGAAAAAAAALAPPPPPAAQRPTTLPATLPTTFPFDEPTTHHATLPAEPNPSEVIKKLFDAIAIKDVDGCRPYLLDPPDDRLELWDLLKPQARILVRKTATRDILEEKEQGEIAIVLFRDTPKDGSAAKYATLLLAHRYTRGALAIPARLSANSCTRSARDGGVAGSGGCASMRASTATSCPPLLSRCAISKATRLPIE